ncbi:hypothetical protein MMC17_008021 [Xylographa soralifera]|nr:hypothetical protein [Xylographa soralifera]
MSSPPSDAPASEPSPSPSMAALGNAIQTEDFARPVSPSAPRLPNLRTVTDSPLASTMTASSTPLGAINAARRPTAPPPTLSTIRSGGLPQDMQAKMKAFQLSRQGAPPGQKVQTTGLPPGSQPLSAGQIPAGAIGGGLALGGQMAPGTLKGPFAGGAGGFGMNARPPNHKTASAPAIPNGRLNPKAGLAAKRGMNGGLFKLSDVQGPAPPTLSVSGPNGDGGNTNNAPLGGTEQKPETAFSKWEKIVDTKTGTLKFAGKATIHGQGIDFQDGGSFSISLDEVDTLEELGKGNYGTVYKVRHSRPQMRRPGQGLQGNKAPAILQSSLNNSENSDKSKDDPTISPQSRRQGNTTGLVMAMKEIRLELDDAKFAAIVMELDILHRCVSPFIVDFYGAFFQEGAVYICMEFMDGGSIDKLYGEGIPENVLRKITLCTVMGLKSLKDEHNIIHRDVKPTNILVNSRGQVKICDFGVSGNLVASIAKTNIGCQSYMAPERIASGGVASAGANPGGGTYSVQSDIWSLGLSIIECAMGRYPYPPETYNNIFSQLSAIVDGDPPDLPPVGFSDTARDFVRSCLHKVPKLRPTYAMLIRHPWLSPLLKPPTISEDDEDEEEGAGSDAATVLGVGGGATTADREVAAWVTNAIEMRRLGKMGKRLAPALHAAPLDAVASPSKEMNRKDIAAGGD